MKMTSQAAMICAATPLIQIGVPAEVPAAISRGGFRVNAEASPGDLLKQLQNTFEEFKKTQEEKVAAKVDDVVLNEKLSAINSTLGELQAALDEQAKKVAAAAIGAGNDKPIYGDIKANPEHTALVKQYMRTGDLAAEAKIKEIQAAITMGAPAEGGLLAPIEWDRTITNRLEQISPIRDNAQVITITGRGFDRVYNDGVIGSGWVGETAARPATATPGLTTLRFETGEIYANPAISQQALDDAAIDLEGWLSGEVDGEFARQENLAFLTGDGTNKPFGILTYVTGAANAARHPFGAIVSRSTAAVGAVAAADIVSLAYDVPTERMTANSKFYMSRATTAVIRLLTDVDGNFIWQPSLQAGQPQMLSGYPIEEVPAMPAIAASAIPVLFGDMGRTYLVVDRMGTRVLRDPFTNKPFVHFYTTRRVGGGVQNPEFMRALVVRAV